MRPAKITLLKCQWPRVFDVAEWETSRLDEATYSLDKLNERLPQEFIEDNFYFLNMRVDGATRIITKAEQIDYPCNDPAIEEKLQVYLEGLDSVTTGNAQKRGKNKRY